MAEEEPHVPLSHEILCQCLSNIQSVVGGGGFAFTQLDCTDKELTHLGNKLETYEHLRYIVLSNNKLTEITAVTALPHLLSLKLDGNKIDSVKCLADAEKVKLPWCQRLDLSKNKLKAVPSLAALERLRFAYFGSNEITSLEGFGAHPTLQELHLQDNQLTTLQGLGTLESLKRLVLNTNQLTSLEGLDAPNLTFLDLGKNQLEKLEHLNGAPACTELDLSDNKLSTEDPHLPELHRLGRELKKVRVLRLAGNPSDMRVEAVLCVKQAHTIDGEAVTEEDREAAKAKKEELVEAVRAWEEAKAKAAEDADAAAANPEA